MFKSTCDINQVYFKIVDPPTSCVSLSRSTTPKWVKIQMIFYIFFLHNLFKNIKIICCQVANSNAMEPEGLRRCMDGVEESAVKVSTL